MSGRTRIIAEVVCSGVRRKQWRNTQLVVAHSVSEILPPHMIARDDNSRVLLEETFLLLRPFVMLNHLAKAHLPAPARQIMKKAGATEPAVARCPSRECMHLLAADACAEITMHHFNDEPLFEQTTLHVQKIHVVREANMRPPCFCIRNGKLYAAVENAKIRYARQGGRDAAF